MAKEALFNDEGSYVKGVVTCVVMDDLVVKPISTTYIQYYFAPEVQCQGNRCT